MNEDTRIWMFPIVALLCASAIATIAAFVFDDRGVVIESIRREEAQIEHKRTQRACLEGGNSPSVCGVDL